jgi:hypothetical protein
MLIIIFFLSDNAFSVLCTIFFIVIGGHDEFGGTGKGTGYHRTPLLPTSRIVYCLYVYRYVLCISINFSKIKKMVIVHQN